MTKLLKNISEWINYLTHPPQVAKNFDQRIPNQLGRLGPLIKLKSLNAPHYELPSINVIFIIS